MAHARARLGVHRRGPVRAVRPLAPRPLQRRGGISAAAEEASGDRGRGVRIRPWCGGCDSPSPRHRSSEACEPGVLHPMRGPL
jgi:hypothetical protein